MRLGVNLAPERGTRRKGWCNEFILLRGSYTNHMLRTPDGWRIERIIQHRSWEYGNTSAVTEATARAQAQAPASRANR